MIKKVKCNVCNYKFFIEKEKVKEVTEDNGVNGVITGKKFTMRLTVLIVVVKKFCGQE